MYLIVSVSVYVLFMSVFCVRTCLFGEGMCVFIVCLCVDLPCVSLWVTLFSYLCFCACMHFHQGVARVYSVGLYEPGHKACT